MQKDVAGNLSKIGPCITCPYEAITLHTVYNEINEF